MFIRNPYNYDREQASYDTGLMCMDKSRAQQNQKEEADINTIVKRFGLTGQLPMAKRLPEYGDFTGINDYHTALNEVRKAEASFMQLPAELRKRFDNDPAEFLEFVMDDKNREEAEKLGLVPKKEPAAAGAVPATKVGGKKGQTTLDKNVESDAE